MKISTLGTILVVIGTIFMLQNLKVYPNAFSDLWPTIIIAIGLTNIFNSFETDTEE